MDDPAPKVEVKFRREMSLLDVTMIGIGAMTGASIFILAGVATHVVGPAILFVILLSFVITILTAMSYAELAGAFPEAGGGYLWVKEGLPHPFGFVGGWISWFGHAIACSFYTVVFGTGIVWLLQEYHVHIPLIGEDIAIKAFAIVALSLFLAVNFFGTKHTGKTGDIVTFTQIGIMVVFVGFAAVKAIQNPDAGRGFSPLLPNGMDSILISLGLFVIAFEGYEIIAQCAEETKEPEKNLPRAIFISVGFVTLLYFLVLLCAIGATSWEFLAGTETNQDATRMLTVVSKNVMPFGAGGTVMIIAMLVGTMATLNATTFSSSRVSFAMARDGALPKSFAKIHKTRRTPHISILASGVIIGVMAVFLPIRDIAAGADIMFILLFIFVNVAVIILRYKRPDLKRTYKIPLFPATPILAILSLTTLAVSIYWFSPIAWYVALAWIEIGMVIYLLGRGPKDIEKAKPETFLSLVERKERPKRYHAMVTAANEQAAPIVTLAAQIARERGGELSIVNVLEVPPSLPPSAMGFNEVNSHMKTVKKLEKVARECKIPTSTSVLISHNVAETILEEAQGEHADLLIMGWKGTSGRGRIFGSTIDLVASKAECDVMVYKSGREHGGQKSIAVLAGTEWHASYATEVASMIAAESGAEITIISVIRPGQSKGDANEYAQRLAGICKGRGVRAQIKLIESKNVVNAAINESEEYDLLVMGASEVVWAPSMVIMGLVEDRIAKDTAVPVLMVRKVKRRGGAKAGAGEDDDDEDGKPQGGQKQAEGINPASIPKAEGVVTGFTGSGTDSEGDYQPGADAGGPGQGAADASSENIKEGDEK